MTLVIAHFCPKFYENEMKEKNNTEGYVLQCVFLDM